MLLIENITSQPFQHQTLVLPDGSVLELTLSFKDQQDGWFITELSYGDFIYRGARICVSPNLLFQFQHKLPFGLACFSQENREPTQQEDFSSGAAKLYILTNAEKEEYARLLSG